jgi:hypothetical protein
LANISQESRPIRSEKQLLEEMDNLVNEAYAIPPERFYLIGADGGADGKVAYHGGAGLHFFDLDEWEQGIKACVGRGAQPVTPAVSQWGVSLTTPTKRGNYCFCSA